MFLSAGVMKTLDFKGHVLNVTTNLKGGPIFNVLCTHEAKFPIYDEAQAVHKNTIDDFSKFSKSPESRGTTTYYLWFMPDSTKCTWKITATILGLDDMLQCLAWLVPHNWWKSEGWKLETSIGLVWNPHSLLRWCLFKKIKNCSDKTSRTMQNVNHAKLCKVQNDKPVQSLWGEVKCHKAQGWYCLRSYQLVGCLMPVLMVDTLCRPIRGQCCWSPWKYPDWFSAICCANTTNTIMLGTLLISSVVMNMLQYFPKILCPMAIVW